MRGETIHLPKKCRCTESLERGAYHENVLDGFNGLPMVYTKYSTDYVPPLVLNTGRGRF